MNAFTRAFFNRVRLFVLAVLILPFIALTASGQCGELIVNGDFEAGNTGFLSQYSYNPLSVWNARTYAVTDNPTSVHECFGGVDHTTGTGKLMVVNGAIYPHTRVWYQTVPVVPNSTYNLSAWVNTQCGTSSRAYLGFRINMVEVGTILAPDVTYVWSHFTASWNSGSATTALIEIFDLNLDYNENDFALDDISFKKVDTRPVITPITGLTMWPPNHNYVTFTVDQLATIVDDCDPSPRMWIAAVGCDEPENGIGDGDGNTYDDIIIAPDCQSVQLRAERDGNGNGRVYTLYLLGMDYNPRPPVRAFAFVTVQHDPETPAIADNAAYGVSGSCFTGKQSAPVSATLQFALEQNYPNPFNPSTEIGYILGDESYVRLVVYDHLGHEIAVLDEGVKPAGAYSAIFNAQDLPSGVYFYQLQTLDGAKTMKMVLTK